MKLVWDADSTRLYETGTKQCVLYPKSSTGTYPKGVAWNGITAVTQSPSGAEPTNLWADDMKYLSIMSAEELGGTIEAYTYPDEWAVCNGEASLATGVVIGQQKRRSFGLCYRTTVGNDVELNDYGYKLHIIYGAIASPSEKAYQTINDSPEAVTFSWEFTTTPVNVSGFKPTSLIEIDSTKVDQSKLQALEAMLYGTDDDDPYLPLPDAIRALFAETTTTYTPVTPEEGDNPRDKGWFEKFNDEYRLTDDTSVIEGKTYYEATVA